MVNLSLQAKAKGTRSRKQGLDAITGLFVFGDRSKHLYLFI